MQRRRLVWCPTPRGPVLVRTLLQQPEGDILTYESITLMEIGAFIRWYSQEGYQHSPNHVTKWEALNGEEKATFARDEKEDRREENRGGPKRIVEKLKGTSVPICLAFQIVSNCFKFA